jgi:FkbM family methyltransferase
MKRLIQSFLAGFGYKIAKLGSSSQTPHEEGLRPLFTLLKQGGFAPRCVIDVGANKGIWTREAMKFFPEAQYVMVEPQAWLREYSLELLQPEKNAIWINAGVADKSGSMALHISKRDDSSSFVLDWGRAKGESGSDVIVEMKTLNEIAAKYCPQPPDMVKVDAEGLDLKVLAGASDIVGKTDVFLAEALVFPTIYDNTLLKILQTMTEAGYRCVEITDVNRSPKHGVAWLIELAFLRNGSPYLDFVTSYE